MAVFQHPIGPLRLKHSHHAACAGACQVIFVYIDNNDGVGDMTLVNGAQVRAARALLRLEQEQLAEAVGIAATTLRRIESFDDRLAARHYTVIRLQRALEAAGVEFTDDGRPGVRMRAPTAA